MYTVVDNDDAVILDYAQPLRDGPSITGSDTTGPQMEDYPPDGKTCRAYHVHVSIYLSCCVYLLRTLWGN